MSTPANFKVCPRCNAALSLAATECSVCHSTFLPVNTISDSYPRAAEASVDSNRWIIALLLAFFLGGFGAHRFYMGHTSIGIAQLILTALGIVTLCLGIGVVFIAAAAIWALVDFIMIACNSLRMADGTALR
jgi:TM2 domain-containing membrane protein YozV